MEAHEGIVGGSRGCRLNEKRPLGTAKGALVIRGRVVLEASVAGRLLRLLPRKVNRLQTRADGKSAAMSTSKGQTNRHERRRRKRWERHLMSLHREADGLVCFEVITPAIALAHPNRDNILFAITGWLRQRNPKLLPLCVGCETGWRTKDEYPAGFLIIRPWRDDASLWSLTGICDACIQRSDLQDRCEALLGTIWPDGRLAQNIHAAPGGLQ